MTEWRGERPLKQARVNFLKAKLEDGNFHAPTWAVAWLNGKKIRVNGKHSSTMLAEANGEFPKGLDVHINEFACSSEDDVAELFGQFDAKGSVRSHQDIFNAHGKICSKISDIAPTSLSKAVNGIAMSLEMETDCKISTDERARLISQYEEFIFWAFGGNEDRHVFMRGAGKRSPVVAAALRTWERNTIDAGLFWGFVASESNPDTEHPTRWLARLLREVAARSSNKGAKSLQWTARAIFVKCIHAWNAFRDGTTTKLSYYANAPIPDVK